MIETLHLDLTSYSRTFNSLSPQGQWFCNRIGKRNYPIQECDYSLLKEFILKNNPNKIFCNSFYGDSLEYSNILNLSKLCYEHEIEFMVFTTGSNLDENLIEELLNYNTTFYLFLTGVDQNASNIILHTKWEDIKNFLKQTKNKTIIEFISYKHNINDIYKVLELCNEYGNNIKITKGNRFEEEVTNIFDEEGHWLHDVLHIENDLPLQDEFLYDVTEALKLYKNLDIQPVKLYRTTQGYLNTRYFFKKDKGSNILNIDLVDFRNQYPLILHSSDEVFINSTNHIFCDRESYEIFNNCLSDDWSKRTERYLSNNHSEYRTSRPHNLHYNESNYVHNVLLKHLFYLKHNEIKCRLVNNLENFYWSSSLSD